MLRSAAASELQGGAAIPWAKKLALWRSGFKSSSYTLFGLAHNDPNDYISDMGVSRARRINGAFGRLLKDKLLFEAALKPYAQVPEVLGLIERGRLFPLAGERDAGRNPGRGGGGHKGVQAGIRELLTASPQGIILKPTRGNKGRGVISVLEQDGFVMNARRVTPTELETTFSSLDGYLVTARVQQAAYAAHIFNGSANTIRVVTMTDPDTGEVFLPAAIHRFGSVHTAPTDNFQTGGVSAAVDLQSGRLGRAARHPSFTGGALEWRSTHPDTGAAIEGVEIPAWPEVAATLKRAVAAYPFLRYVGWDVVVTETGVCLIEGNHNINLGLQVHAPLLRNPRVRRFFEFYGVIPKRA